jgi:hypothetical protein
MSIVAGIRYDTPQVKLDYTRCEEPFVPYYPDMKDGRRVSRSVEPIVCIPTNRFFGARVALLRRDFNKARMLVRRKIQGLRNRNGGSRPALSRGHSGDEWTNKEESGVAGLLRRVLKRYVLGQIHIADLSRLNYPMMCCMMEHTREQAAKSGLAHVPVILENHTKDVFDFVHIERFIANCSRSADVKVATLTEIAHGLRNGTFKVRTASSA